MHYLLLRGTVRFLLASVSTSCDDLLVSELLPGRFKVVGFPSLWCTSSCLLNGVPNTKLLQVACNKRFYGTSRVRVQRNDAHIR